jgi:hypothetical protein
MGAVDVVLVVASRRVGDVTLAEGIEGRQTECGNAF